MISGIVSMPLAARVHFANDLASGSGCSRGARPRDAVVIDHNIAEPPWPNGQGVGLLIRRLWVRVPLGVNVFLARAYAH